MIDLPGVAALLSGVVLLAVSAAGLAAVGRFKSLVSNILAVAIIAYATIVLLAQILSELGWVGQAGFLMGHTLVAVLVLVFTQKQFVSLVNEFGEEFRARVLSHLSLRRSPALSVLGLSVLAAMVWGGYLILISPPNNYDSFWYHLSRVAHWLHEGTLRHFQTADMIKTVHQGYNGEIGLLWLTALWGTDQLTGFNQWLAVIFTMVGIYGVARRLEFPPLASLFAALIWSTLTIIVAQSTSTKNDILVSFFGVAAYYFLITGLREDEQAYRANFVLFGLSLGLALGTKSVALLVLPGIALLAGLLLLQKPGRYWPRLIYAGLCCLVGFALLGSYNYALNWLQYRSIMGPAEEVEIHGIQNPSIGWFASNFGRIMYHFFDPGGLPDPLVDQIQQWRPLLGQKVFALLHIEPNPPGLNFAGSNFSFSDTRQISANEGLAWFGPLGFLLFLPALFYYLLHPSSTENALWRRLTALIPLSFLVIFALFIRWQPYIGRLTISAVTLGSPLLAGFFVWSEKYKFLRWLVLITAITVLGWSASHNHDKPVFGSETVWNLDYYELRTIDKAYLVAAYPYVDRTVPETARLGVAGVGLLQRWDYLLFGPTLKRDVVNLGPIPKQIDLQLFTQHNLDYLIFDAGETEVVDSVAPLWPVVSNDRVEWYLVKRSEAELFSKPDPATYEQVYQADYLAYVRLKAVLDQTPAPVRVLTTDPRMAYYDADARFVFELPRSLGKLREFTHLIVAPGWSAEDYERLGMSPEDIRFFLSQEQFIKKIYEINGYVLYQILI